MLRMKRALAPVGLLLPLILALARCTAGGPPDAGGPVEAPTRAELLWDEWGVPHIFAEDAAAAFRAFGWAQMKSHGDLLLQLYAQARGESARYLGAAFQASDEVTRAFDLPRIGAEAFAAESASFAPLLEAFVEGANLYASYHEDELDPRLLELLPLVPEDVTRHGVRMMTLFVHAAAPNGCTEGLPGLNLYSQPGSNGWAIAPARTESGEAMLLANPHLQYQGGQTFFEAHMVVGDDLNISGATLVGFPTLAIAFTERVAWTHTINTLDACDTYALVPEGDGYRFDGEPRAFEVVTDTLAVRSASGVVNEVNIELRRSVHGPVFPYQGDLYAVRIAPAALPQPGMFAEWWEMAQASNLTELEAALDQQRLPLFTVLAADHEGAIVTRFGGRVPDKGVGDATFWANPVDGSDAALLWESFHPAAELPRVRDPSSGYVQNANSPPWFATVPGQSAGDFPPWIAPRGPATLREQRSLALLSSDATLTLAELEALKHDTGSEMAERVLDELISAANASTNASAQSAAAVLADWNGRYDSDATGAVLFAFWSIAMTEQAENDLYAADPLAVVLGPPFAWATPWSEDDPLTTPRGLGDPDRAVATLAAVFNELGGAGPGGFADAALGDVARFRRGAADYPANGGPDHEGVFRVTEFAPAGTTYEAASGDTFVAAVEMTTPVRARVLLGYGNASQPGSPHVGDQFELASTSTLRDAWRKREEVMPHLEHLETVPPDSE